LNILPSRAAFNSARKKTSKRAEDERKKLTGMIQFWILDFGFWINASGVLNFGE
jgi:hypothetical protein